MNQLDAVIFDLGGVVLEWVPQRAFEQVMPRSEVPAFMDRISFHDWNRTTDAGRSFAEAEAELIGRFPDYSAAIRAYRTHYLRTLTGMVPGTPAVLAELGQANVPVMALTNWSAETFPLARDRFGILGRFQDIVVSGERQVAKPDPAIFEIACQRWRFAPDRTIFVDDSPANVAAANRFGLRGLLFTGADRLRDDLVGLALLPPSQPVEAPVFHWALHTEWDQALASGRYPWSGRGLEYEAAGFVHCFFEHQLAQTRTRFYADLADSEVVLLRLDPAGLPFVIEEGFPHLFAPLPVQAAEVTPLSR